MENSLAQRLINRLSKEPPFRLVLRTFVWAFSQSIRMRAEWDASPRPQYLVGVLKGADRAAHEGYSEVSVIEFGVAHGEGLLALQEIAAAVEKDTNVRISVYGFDTGKGLPDTTGDFRNQPDRWKAGDFAMNDNSLCSRLASRTKLILGDVADTVPNFVANVQNSPVAFIAVDLDLYSSTCDALRVLTLPGKRILLHVPLYFDDVGGFQNNRFTGELLAIEEFNQNNDTVKIDVWRGIADDRPFPEQNWIKGMYVAHDLAAISSTVLPPRPPLKLFRSRTRLK